MRTENSTKNMITGILSLLTTDILNFAVRTVFIYILGREYLGISDLFKNILTMLSITELGIGTAIIYNLYKPLAENNTEKIKSYMRLYKYCYRCIALIIFVLGVCVIPFLPWILQNKTPDISENLTVIYLMFLTNTSVSYLLTYKRSLIIADQKLSLVNIYTMCFSCLMYVVQAIVLVISKQYLVYLTLQILTTLSINIMISIKCNKLYPYIKEKNAQPLTKAEKKEVFLNVKALMLYKVSDQFVTGSDNILISRLIDFVMVGLYSNYLMITTTIRIVLMKLFDSITASIGNLNVTSSNQRKKEIFEIYNFAAAWLNGFCAICLLCLLPDFIVLWIGEGYLLHKYVLLIIVILFYIVGILLPVSNYRYATGLFKYGQLRPVLMPIINIIASVLFAKKYGLAGIFLGTIVARLSIQVWFDPWIIYKHGFKCSIKSFYKKNIFYLAIVVISCLASVYICSLISFGGWGAFICKGIVCGLLPNAFFYIAFSRKSEFLYLKGLVMRMLNRKKVK